MSAYVLGERIWVIERRGTVIWMREGKRGSRGRTTYEELASEAEARARVAAITAEHEVAGFALVDASRSIDAPLYVEHATAKATGTSGLDVAELHAALRRSTCSTPGGWLNRFVEITATTCVWRLLRVSFSTAEDGSHVELEAVFGKGRGSNPDGYDEDGYRVRLTTPALARDDLEDRLDVDVFADELGRMSQTKMVATFRRGVEDLASFAALRDARVVSADVDRIA